jgi:hypothetical protein
VINGAGEGETEKRFCSQPQGQSNEKVKSYGDKESAAEETVRPFFAFGFQGNITGNEGRLKRPDKNPL